MDGINTTFDNNGTLAMDLYGDYEDFGSYGFENPFERPPIRILFITIYSIVFAMCILGNSMVLFAIARSPRLRSMTNFFLANLAIADLCVGAFCVLPNLSTFLSPNWILGQAMCKIYYYIWNVMYTASIIILTVIAIERYIAIIHPLKARNLMTHRKLKIAQSIIWLIALLYNVPYIFFYDTFSFVDYDKLYCYPNSEYIYNLKVLSLANFIIWYVCPLILIGFMYYRVALALWKTTVVSALRLQPYPTLDTDSFRSNTSTKLLNINPESQTDKQKSSAIQDSRLTEGNERSYSSENSRSSDQAVLFKGKQTIVIVCTLPKNDSIKPEMRRPIPSSSSDGNVSDFGLRTISDDREASSVNTFNGTCVKQRYKYRQTLNSSSRRVCRARKKVIKLLVSVVVMFGVCVLPHMMKVLNHYWRIITVDQSIDVIISPCSFIVLFLNSAMNPILYALFSNNFRRSFKEAIPCFKRRSWLRERLKS